MKLFDYVPHIYIKDDFYYKRGCQFLNIYDTLHWLQKNMLTDQVIKVFKSGGRIPNTTLRSVPFNLKWRTDQRFHFEILCETNDEKMFNKYVTNELRDSLCIKYFKNGPWPFMHPVSISGPNILYKHKALQVKRWADEYGVVCKVNK